MVSEEDMKVLGADITLVGQECEFISTSIQILKITNSFLGGNIFDSAVKP